MTNSGSRGHDPWLPKYEKAYVLRNQDSPDQVLTMAFFDGTQQEYDAARDDPATMAAEEARLHRIAEYEERGAVRAACS